MLAAVVTLREPPATGAPPSAGARAFAAPSPESPEACLPLVRSAVAAVLRVPPSHADVDDVASETMRRAVEGRDRLRPGEPLRPWVLGIARHVALDALRRRGRERPLAVPTTPDSSGDVSVLDTLPDDAPGAEERVDVAQRALRVRAALADLPEGMRDALTLFYVEGRPYQGIAEAMGVPLGTVATWIARGRKLLAERLKEEVLR